MFIRKKKLLLRLELENKFICQITSDELDRPITIGRDRNCDWRIPAADRSASNRHAELFLRRGRVCIRDLGSHNGVYFLGEKITERAVSPGDRYGIGDAVLSVSQARENDGTETGRKFHRLEQLNGKNRKKVYELSAASYTIGSADDAEIRIEDTLVSRRHARLELKNDGTCWVIDLGSRNGTFVNRLMLSAENTDGRMLQQGDTLSVGSVDFCFYDRNVMVQKSYFLLKSLCAAATVAVILSGYFFWQSLLPTSKDHIERAKKLSESRQFDAALRQLDKAADASKAASYRAESADLRKQIENWRKTTKKWEETKQLISNRRWVSGNKILAGLVAGKGDVWNWNNTDAIESRRQALLMSEVLEPFLHARILMSESGTGVAALETDLAKLNAALRNIAGRPEEYFQLLYAEGKIISGELAYVTDRLKQIEKTVAAANADRRFEKDIGLLEAISREALERSREPEKVRRRLTAQLVPNRCRIYLSPLKAFAAAQKQFRHNLEKLASMEFRQLHRELPLPKSEECVVSPVFTSLRSEMLSRNETLLQRGKQLEYLTETLKKRGIVPGKQPEMLQKWQEKGFADRLLSCDCFKYDARLWAANRKKPVGVFDAFLGIEFFWDFLRGLPGKFDAALLDERPFVPEIVQIRNIYGDLEVFRGYIEDPVLGLLLSQEVKKPRLQDLALWVDELLTRRDNTLTGFVRRSRECARSRDALILGGAVLILDAGKNADIAGEYGRLAGLFGKLRREVSGIADQDAVPEQVIRNRRTIVALGLPGDPAVRKAFYEMSEEKK
ncbi:MAG: FHA domain-containing protein [Lentisphaeria bacterium]|nr:FHA domain-containing protein [Lentisphaeria bacterium]